jgi:hypothetical protein
MPASHIFSSASRSKHPADSTAKWRTLWYGMLWYSTFFSFLPADRYPRRCPSGTAPLASRPEEILKLLPLGQGRDGRFLRRGELQDSPLGLVGAHATPGGMNGPGVKQRRRRARRWSGLVGHRWSLLPPGSSERFHANVTDRTGPDRREHRGLVGG